MILRVVPRWILMISSLPRLGKGRGEERDRVFFVWAMRFGSTFPPALTSRSLRLFARFLAAGWTGEDVGGTKVGSQMCSLQASAEDR